jgi:hypothetical protein
VSVTFNVSYYFICPVWHLKVKSKTGKQEVGILFTVAVYLVDSFQLVIVISKFSAKSETLNEFS